MRRRLLLSRRRLLLFALQRWNVRRFAWYGELVPVLPRRYLFIQRRLLVVHAVQSRRIFTLRTEQLHRVFTGNRIERLWSLKLR